MSKQGRRKGRQGTHRKGETNKAIVGDSKRREIGGLLARHTESVVGECHAVNGHGIGHYSASNVTGTIRDVPWLLGVDECAGRVSAEKDVI